MNPTDNAPKLLAAYARTLEALHKNWQPHPGQVPLGKALFHEGVKRLMVSFGRQSGKSEFALYSIIRWALTNPNSRCYYVAPLQRQIREIVWSSGRLLGMIPKEFVESVNNTEMRVRLTNGSFIKIDGSDDIESLRGLTISYLVIDEYKDCSPQLLEVIKPALLRNNAPLVVLGTPPESAENHFVKLMDEARTSDSWRFYTLPSSCNPYLPKDELIETELLLRSRGEEDVWQREYMGRFVAGGARAVFPQFDQKKHVVDHETMLARIHRERDKWQWHCVMDPGTASVFAVLFVGVNHYTREIWILDEIYEQNLKFTTIGQIWPICLEKQKGIADPQLLEDEAGWVVTVDEAALWARMELLDRYGISSWPTAKTVNKKAEGISLIKDLMLTAQKLRVSDRCKNLIHEVENYQLNKRGEYIKRADHLIDCFRYLLAAAAYTVVESAQPVPNEVDRPRTITAAQDMRNEGFFESPFLLDE